MITSDLKKYLDLAVTAAKAAGNLLHKTADKDIIINSNIDKDIKLAADEESEQLIIQILSKGSDFNILSEESGLVNRNNNTGYTWIVDPLDGSLNYLRGIDIYAVSIGLWNENEPVLGVVYNFLHNQLYTGLVGDGAYCNEQKIRVSDISDKSKSIIATGFPVYTNFNQQALLSFTDKIQVFKKVRLFGSAAMSLIHVAKGSIEVYSENDIAIWDVAAGLAIVVAAGGNFTATEAKGPNYLNVFATNNLITQ